MANNELTYFYNITSAGGTKSFDVASGYTRIMIIASPTPTLAAAMIFNHTGTPIDGDIFKINYVGGVTSNVGGGKYVSFFGQELSDPQALYGCSITAFYLNATWNVIVNPTVGLYQAFGNIPGYAIQDGSMLASVFPDDKIPALKLNTASLQGFITPSMLSFVPVNYYVAQVTIPSASVLTLNGTPITIVAAPGAGYYIDAISATSEETFVSAAYATNTTVQLICDTATVAQLQDSAILISTVSKITKFEKVTAATAGQTQIIENKALQIKVATGNPTAGDSDIKISVIYRIVAI